MHRLAALSLAVPLIILGCGGSDSESTPDPTEPTTASATPPETSDPSEPPEPTTPTWTPAPMVTGEAAFDRKLHAELMAMFRRDQAGQTGGVDKEGYAARTERLKEVIAEYGWPTFDLVGKDGADAAWVIAQHSDHDPEFQAVALRLLRSAAVAEQASWGNVAYLTDRVAVAEGAKQTYGTQISCLSDGAEPATPLKHPDRVDELRAKAGLDPLQDYLDEMTAMCTGGQ